MTGALAPLRGRRVRRVAAVAIAAAAVALCVGAARVAPETWARNLERAQRWPALVLARPDRSSFVQGGLHVTPFAAGLETLESHALPSDSPVIAVAESGGRTAVATFDDGLCVISGEACAPIAVGQQVNDVAAGEAGSFWVATADGAFRVNAQNRVEPLEEGSFSAVTTWHGQPWFVSARGLSTIDEHGFVTLGAEHGFTAEQPGAIAACGDTLCIGAQDGLWTFDGQRAWRRDGRELPTDFVTAVSSAVGAVWVGTFDGGLAELRGGHARRIGPADGLPDARIEPRAVAQVGPLALAGTPSGLLVIDGSRAALVSDGLSAKEITAVRSTGSGIWIGYRGGLRRVKVVVP